MAHRMIEGIVTEGLLLSILALGVFITFRILDFPDLTVDGSYAFGACIFGAMVVAGYSPVLAVGAAFLGGVLAGFITAAIHNFLKVPNLLAGIITMIMLYSLNHRVLGGRANLTLGKNETILSTVKDLSLDAGIASALGVMLAFFVMVIVIKLLLDIFFRTELGITMGALGNNPQVVISSGVDPRTLKMLGLGLSNGLVALAGAFAAQHLGAADINLGQFRIIAGLAAVMIGEFLLRSNRIWILTIRVILGSLIFSAVSMLARRYGYAIGFVATDQRFLEGVLIVLALVFSQVRKKEKKPFYQLIGLKNDPFTKPDAPPPNRENQAQNGTKKD